MSEQTQRQADERKGPFRNYSLTDLVRECRFRYSNTPSLPVLELCDEVERTAAELRAVRAERDRQLEAVLTAWYARSTSEAVEVARLCDETLDTSGALLGRVRVAAAALAASSAPGDGGTE